MSPLLIVLFGCALYSYTDEQPLSGINYYRLKVVGVVRGIYFPGLFQNGKAIAARKKIILQ